MIKPIHQKGLSLLELMVTMAIIGIVTAIAVPAYNSYVFNANTTPCVNEVANIRLVQEEFFMTNNTYFQGANVAALEVASGNLYDASPEFTNGTANCTVAVVPGPNGLNREYRIIATGANSLPNTYQHTQQNY